MHQNVVGSFKHDISYINRSRSRTVQIMLLSAALAFFGINAPIVILVRTPLK